MHLTVNQYVAVSDFRQQPYNSPLPAGVMIWVVEVDVHRSLFYWSTHYTHSLSTLIELD